MRRETILLKQRLLKLPAMNDPIFMYFAIPSYSLSARRPVIFLNNGSTRRLLSDPLQGLEKKSTI